jgi:hypothetical protein
MTPPERIQTSLRFLGDWPAWAGIGLALALGAVAWLLYRREMQRQTGWLRVLLPTLRALAIAMMVLMLAGPVLHHRKIIGQLSRLFLFVDGSASMGLSDASMDAGRKLSILQRLGLLRAGAVPGELPQAGAALAEAQSLAERSKLSHGATAEEWKKLTDDFAMRVEAARAHLGNSGVENSRVDDVARNLVKPAADLAKRETRQIDDRQRAIAELQRLGEVAAVWTAQVQTLFQRQIESLTADDASPLKAALEKFDALPRWQRLQAMLLEGESDKLLARLGENYDVQLLALDGSEAKKIWQPTRKDSSLPTQLPKPAAAITNLATGLKTGVGEQEKEQRGAVVLFSDGQHNDGESPADLARVFAARGMPMFTVGFGSQVRPRDLAVLQAEGPEAVFFEDRVRGEITLKDDMPAGAPFKLTVSAGDKLLWERALTTEGRNVRKVAYDFAIGDYVKERMKAQRSDVQMSSLPLDFRVAVSQIEGDRQPGNNAGSLRVRAVTQKRRILLLDGRPRWETRYLRNLFERDEQWEVNCVTVGMLRGEAGFARGTKPEQFPLESGQLQSHDLIIFGEVPRATFKGDELAWLRDFVEKRGGAMVFIDGARGRLREYADSPIGPLFPVDWKSTGALGVRDGLTRVSLTERSAGLAAFALAPDRAQNGEVWSALPAPRWVSGATPLAGAETLLEVEASGQKLAGVVLRPFGAGKALYQSFDESWRWRYEVADQHHVRYWNQVANWIAELPFAVRDKFVSLDAGAITYRPGDSADLRVRLRDGEGRPVTNATVDAVLYRDGQRAATIRLLADDNAGGLFRGRTAALEPGAYEVGIESVAIPASELKARTEFKVEPRETGELTQLSVNEDLLRQMAAAGGGEYLREENISRLADLLAPMSQGKVIETDTALWQSYWWFVPVVLLLTAEWIIRKRTGLL